MSLAGGVFFGQTASATVLTAGQLVVIAGSGAGSTPRAGPATASPLASPYGVAVDGSGNVYIADTLNDEIEKVTPAGDLSIIAGGGSTTPTTSGTPALSASIGPQGIAVNASGSIVYIADSENYLVEELTGGKVWRIAGGGVTTPAAGPAITATSAALDQPTGVAVDGSGNLYIADQNRAEVEEVSEPAGTLSVIAGNGTEGPTIVGPATLSPLGSPNGVAVNALGTILYIADPENGEVDEVTEPAGALSVLAGGPTNPLGVALDASGNLYISNDAPSLVYEETAGALSVIAGGGNDLPSTTPETATDVGMIVPSGVAVDGSGNVYIGDAGDPKIYEVAPSAAAAAAPVFTADSPTAAVIGTPYSYTFTASGSPAPTFSYTGTLPAGLTLTGAGVLAGAPTGPGTFTVTATNATNFVTTASITITPSAAPGGPAPIVKSPSPVTPVPPVPLPVPPVTTVPSPLLVPTGGGAAATPTGAGYWALTPGGDLSEHGIAGNFGSENTANLNAPIVAVNSTTSGQGYWLAGADGGVFNFGDARFFGSLGGTHLNGLIVAMSRTANNGGYLLAGADGGVFAFGDAAFEGSMAGMPLNRAITSMVPVPGSKGYWLVGADGGVFSFGGAQFYGSLGATDLDRHIVGIAATPDGKGYWLVGANGVVTAFGDAKFFGSLGATGTTRIVGIVADADVGYRLITAQGDAVAFGTTPTG
jgi:sugar lactone lactonase YvrE